MLNIIKSASDSRIRAGHNWSLTCTALLATALSACDTPVADPVSSPSADPTPVAVKAAVVDEGRTIFRFDTFGDETFWTDTLRMHEVIRTAVSPTTALSVGLKVDADALPPEVKAGILNKTISLTDPATTVALLKLNAVVG